MKRNLIITEDGSPSLHVPELSESYHSKHGAIQESMHVYIQTCLAQINKPAISLFEVGFGTGLNAWLAYEYAKNYNITLDYHCIELFPLLDMEYQDIAQHIIQQENNQTFLRIHEAEWNHLVSISPFFNLHKIHQNMLDFSFDFYFDGCFFDAFSPSSQPELWTNDIFDKIFQNMNPGGVLSTYCAQGKVRRSLAEVGFTVERLQGPPGKREILRAQKIK